MDSPPSTQMEAAWSMMGAPRRRVGVPPSVWDGWACTWQKEASWHADGVAVKISEIRSFSH